MLLGRQREIAHIEELLEGAKEGKSAALLLHGEAGIGKSALLRAALDAGIERDFGVLRTRGFESESDIPFAGLLELLTPLLHLRGQIPEVQAAALGSALALEPPTPFDRFAVPAGMLSLLAAAAEEKPYLVVADDVHWLDDASREALIFVARRLGAEGVVLLCAARVGGDGVAVLEAFEGVADQAIGGLDDEAAAQLLKREARHRVAEEVAHDLVVTAAGNPLALTEMPRTLSADQLAGREPLAGPVPAGEQIENAFARQVADLPDATRDALLVASAMQTGRHDLFLQALERRGLPADALDAAMSAGLVTLDGRIEFFHPLLRSAIYHAADPVKRRSVHATLADLSTTPARRAWHLAAAADAPDEEVAAALESAASEARARGGVVGSARAFERAANLSTDDEARARRLLEAASDFAQSGHADHALALVGRAQELVPGGALATEVVRVRGRVEMRRGAPVTAHDLLRDEADRIQDDNPGVAASLLVEAAVAHMMTGDMEALVATGDRARSLLGGREGVSDPVIEVLAGVLVGEAHAALGHEHEADALLDPALPFLTSEYVLAMPSELVGMAGQCSIWYERWDRASAVLDHLVTIARDASAINHIIYPLTAHAVLDFRRGYWSAALANAAEATRLARETRTTPLLTFALSVLAHVEAAVGRRDDARAHGREGVQLSELLGGPAITVYGLNALALDALGAGEIEAAVEYYDRVHRFTLRLQTQRGLVQYGADRVEALARLGRTEDAFQALEAFADQLGGGRWALAALARCRGILADKTAEHHFQTALSHHEHDGQPFEKARTQLAYGERLRRDRRRADAREQLVEALDAFERLGAMPWAERARVELRATGGAAAAETDSAHKDAVAAAGLDELTAHELQIARLVAYGMTNREVAAKLFLSPKTIEYHLSQIYRKLDLRSRTQLASLMASEMPDAPKAA
ncbi:MAG TPA: AAA family ATPase [Baekduia sp.]|uniref:helix-turn-helix transcriptional regulator n=1 Tax=Baekduia sp. TaxID=2600305 RepID=UPI002D7805BB|nr:AAA family ATPase [Baekduia sp.]HET6510460.1 AAA family ATPase [Baekduia sp.]